MQQQSMVHVLIKRWMLSQNHGAGELTVLAAAYGDEASASIHQLQAERRSLRHDNIPAMMPSTISLSGHEVLKPILPATQHSGHLCEVG